MTSLQRMRVPLTCMECICRGCPAGIKYAALRDDSTYEVQCEQGHSSVVVTQAPKFENLYEIGLHALYDGYADAAITRFSVSLERFYDFCVQYWLYDKGYIKKSESYDAYWKQVAVSSERQNGAFTLLYSMEREKNETLPQLSGKITKLRNDVIHKGTIPTKYKARDFAEEIFNFITPILRTMKNHNLYYSQLSDSWKNAPKKNKRVSTLSMPTTLRRYKDKTFNEAWENFKPWLG